MVITSWQQHTRVISGPSIRDFYDRPICETHAFLFDTQRLELPSHAGSFSLKLVLSGEEEYRVGKRIIRIRPGEMLFINGGEIYGSRIRIPTRSLSIFFPTHCVADVQRLLFPEPAGGAEWSPVSEKRVRELPQFRFSATKHTWDNVLRFAELLIAQRADVADESAMHLLHKAWANLHDIAPPSALVSVQKKSIRDELLGRIALAREYIDDMCGIDCTLDTLAATACLSKYHFLRVFKEVIGESPASYARRARLRLASDAIARGQNLEAAALRAGYANGYSLGRALGRRRHQKRAN